MRGRDGLHLLFVNDGSTDGTAALLAELCAGSEGRVSVLNLDRNGGKAEAVRQGMRRAGEWKPRFVGFWDADLATPLADAAVFEALLQRNDRLFAVFGARVKLLGRHIRRNEQRHYLERVFATFVSVILQTPAYDTQCGAKLFRGGAVLDAILEAPFLSPWIFDVEILARLRQLHRAGDVPPIDQLIYEHPLMHWEDVGGSKLRRIDFVRAATDLWRIYRHYRQP